MNNKNLTQKIIFTSYSKKNFYLRAQISAFVLVNNAVPISPFMNWDYNLSGIVEKSLIRIANNSMISRSDELWVFGEVSDGVLVEIFLAKKQKKPVRYFKLNESYKKFEEIGIKDVLLEDISPWMWEWVISGKNLERWHPRLRFKKSYPLVYPAYSKRNFYWQMHISKYCIQNLHIPLNPFMLFRYFLGDLIPRDAVYGANQNIVKVCDELWTFGEISDGVLKEIETAKDYNKKVRHLKITDGDPPVFRQVGPNSAPFEEDEMEKYRNVLLK